MQGKMQTISQNFQLIFVLTKAHLKSRYRKTWAGFLWVIINPIATFVIQALLFKNILKIDTAGYYTFLLSGIIPWIFISSTWSMTTNMFINQRSTFLAFKIHPWVFLSSQVLDNFINYFTSYVLLFIFVDLTLLFNPIVIILMILYSLGLMCFVFFSSFFLANMQAIFRDTQFVLQFILNLAYFVTPIFYPFNLLPDKFKQIIMFNPIYYMIKPFQDLFWKKDYVASLNSFLLMMILNALVVSVTLIFWKKNKDEIFYKL